jgi:hypothetical protein
MNNKVDDEKGPNGKNEAKTTTTTKQLHIHTHNNSISLEDMLNWHGDGGED